MKFHLMAKISEHPDIPATTHLGLYNICINNSRGLPNRYAIDIIRYQTGCNEKMGDGVRLSYHS